MAYTVEEIFLNSCALIDSLTDAGIIDATTTADYRGRTLALVDIAQKELSTVANTYKIYELARNKVQSLFKDQNFKVEVHDGVNDSIHVAINDEVGSARSYYFETDASSGTVFIEDYTTTWNVLTSITLTNTNKAFKEYFGTVTPTAGATKSRIRFTGNFFYRYTNFTLYSYPFNTGEIPPYRQWVPIELPEDVKHIQTVNIEYYNKVYTTDPSYKIEWNSNRQTILVDYEFEGTMKIQYIPFPVKPSSFSTELEVDDTTAQCIAYYLAFNFVSTDKDIDLRNQLRSQYEGLRAELRLKQPESERPMVDYYGGMDPWPLP